MEMDEIELGYFFFLAYQLEQDLSAFVLWRKFFRGERMNESVPPFRS